MNNIEKANFERLKRQYENAPQDKDGVDAVTEFVNFLLNHIETLEEEIEALEINHAAQIAYQEEAWAIERKTTN